MVSSDDNAQEFWAIAMEFADCWQSRQPDSTAIASMETLLTDYRLSPVHGGQGLREWKYSDPDTFWSTAFYFLRGERSEDTYAALRTVIRSIDDLADLLLDTRSLRRTDAIRLAQRMCQHRANLDIDLAARVRSARTNTPGYFARVLRLLDVIETVSDPLRIASLVLGFRQLGDPRVTSKITLLLGRTTNRHVWIREQLNDADPRLRANAVEGLWRDVPDDETVRLLWKAVRDSHHRVVGNALVGLCRMGEQAAWEVLAKMARHSKPPFRAAAAWAMGELGEPAFANTLHKLARTETGSVRQNALKALVKIRKVDPVHLERLGPPADPDPIHEPAPAHLGSARNRGVLLED